MKGISYQTCVEQIKLTLNELADADLIAILNAMPYGNKAKLIGSAIRRCYTTNDKGELVVLMDEPTTSAAPPTPKIEAQKNLPKGEAKAKPIKIEVETF